jgi:rhodanese-related sulfurtransferase
MAWLMSGRAVDQLEQISPHQLAGRLEKSNIRIIDVRTPAEWNASRIKWAEHFPLSDILEDQLPDGKKDEELVLQCGSGYRSNIAASIMRRRGICQCEIPGRRRLCLVQCGLPGCPVNPMKNTPIHLLLDKAERWKYIVDRSTN